MKPIINYSFCIALLFLASACSEKQPADNTLSKAEAEAGWTLMFDGQTLDGWRNFQGDTITGWVVEDGTLRALGQGSDLSGYIVSEKQYGDFDLTLDWKIAPEANSGILYLVLEDTFKTPYETGPEYQLIDDVNFPEPLEEWQKTGANYAMHVAENKELKPAGEWNTTRILVDHGHVEHWLNGRKVLEYELWSDDWKALVAAGKWKDYPGYGSAKKGYIALQDHGSIVWFRNIKIREL
jgi:hypothetical protein